MDEPSQPRRELPPVRRFRHEAMATTWELLLPMGGADDDLAREVFAEIDHLEGELSRFRPDSDVGRLNALPAGETLPVGPATLDCLLLARDVHAATRGAFDITVRPLQACWTNPDGSLRNPSASEVEAAAACCGMDHVVVDAANWRAGTAIDHLDIDLGGVGKGYALDQVGDRLAESLGCGNFLLNAGSSTILARGPGPGGGGWPVLAGRGREPIELRDEALSGSGGRIQGHHIIDPRTRRPVDLRERDQLWVRTRLASVADAFSTAFLVLDRAEAQEVLASHPELALME